MQNDKNVRNYKCLLENISSTSSIIYLSRYCLYKDLCVVNFESHVQLSRYCLYKDLCVVNFESHVQLIHFEIMWFLLDIRLCVYFL